VAGYPENIWNPHHFRLKRLKEKVDAGLIMWLLKCSFDNAKYFEFVDKARAMGIPFLLIKPIAVQRHLQYCHNFRIDLPEDLIQAVDGCKKY
jgi:methylenetetrahydrofolate reductase (NADPH)